MLYVLALAAVKISVLLFLQKAIFHGNRFWKASIGLICLFSIYSFAEVLVVGLQCKPVVLGQSFQSGNCVNMVVFEITLG